MQVARLSRDELAIRKAILAYGAALEMFIPGAAYLSASVQCTDQFVSKTGRHESSKSRARGLCVATRLEPTLCLLQLCICQTQDHAACIGSEEKTSRLHAQLLASVLFI